jgi:hypothetical protein
MINKSEIFEERRIRLKQASQLDISGIKKYLSLFLEELNPKIEENNGKIICVLQGIVGSPTNELLQIIRFPDLHTYQQMHAILNNEGTSLLESKETRLFKSITSRPKDPFPIEDHCPIYSDRRFFLRNYNIEKCADLSENLIWPLYEGWGARVLGLFTTILTNEIQEVMMFAGYNSIAHWEETRNIGFASRPKMIPQKVWKDGKKAVIKRAELTLKSTVSLMKAIYLTKN